MYLMELWNCPKKELFVKFLTNTLSRNERSIYINELIEQYWTLSRKSDNIDHHDGNQIKICGSFPRNRFGYVGLCTVFRGFLGRRE